MMTKTEFKKMQADQTIWLNRYAGELWVKYHKIFPKLRAYSCPEIKLNNRFTSKAGVCYVQSNRVELAAKYLAKFQSEVLTVTLPHELAHQIDFNFHGLPEGNRWHGEKWQGIMVDIGLPPVRCHSMSL